MALKDYPEWVLKHKKKGIELRCIKGKYSAYRVSSKWDPIKKRSKKITGEYLGVITPKGITPPKNKLTSLNEEDKSLKYLQILKELEAGKEKPFLAEKYSITTKTIDNIQKRFDKYGLKGLIHTRESKNEFIKISSKDELNIIGELIENPEKTAKEIKKSLNIKTPINKIETIINPIKELLKSKKKTSILLKIEK